VEGDGGVVPGLGGGAGGLEGADETLLAVVLDAGVVLVVALVVGDADVLAGAAFARALVAGVLRAGAEAEVALRVVPAAVVDVVDDETLRGLHDHAVHAELALAVGADGVERVGLLRGAPLVPGQGRVVLRVHPPDDPACEQQQRGDPLFEDDLDGEQQVADGASLRIETTADGLSSRVAAGLTRGAGVGPKTRRRKNRVDGLSSRVAAGLTRGAGAGPKTRRRKNRVPPLLAKNCTNFAKKMKNLTGQIRVSDFGEGI